jgi:hypothetical protein
MAAGAILWLGIDGHWPAMHFARLLHLVVRFYRLEELIELKAGGGPDLFAGRLDPIALKHLAAFDWVAASLMSPRFNESYARSEEFVAEYGLSDPAIAGIAYGSPGHVAFAGAPPVLAAIHGVIREVMELAERDLATGDDAQGRLTALEALYQRILSGRADLMAAMGYTLAELHAIVAPSLEDLQFLSNAAVQGRLVAVERRERA